MSVPRKTAQAVLDSLRQAARPLTRMEVAEATGLSYNTVKSALSELPVKVGKEGRADVYSFGKSTTDSGKHLRWRSPGIRGTGRHIRVDELELPNPVDAYDRTVHSLPMGLPVELAPDMDPAELAKELANYGTFLVNLAAMVSEHQNDPSWYRKLGGTTKTYTNQT